MQANRVTVDLKNAMQGKVSVAIVAECKFRDFGTRRPELIQLCETVKVRLGLSGRIGSRWIKPPRMFVDTVLVIMVVELE